MIRFRKRPPHVYGPQTKILEDYAPQTKILEGRTKDEIWILEVLLSGVITRFGLRATEKSIEGQYVIFCSTFQNLRLGAIKIERSFA
jgi:hypothetical protein